MTSTRQGQARTHQGHPRARRRAWRLVLRAAGGGLGIAATWAGAAHGIWVLPFVVGVLVGAVGRRVAVTAGTALAAACLIGLAGWGLPLVWLLIDGEPVGSTARTVAALAGLPPYAAVILAAALLIAVLQAAIGSWLGWSVAALAPAAPTTGDSGRPPGTLDGVDSPGRQPSRRSIPAAGEAARIDETGDAVDSS